jgi:UTP--glucose-1-phosphate uridylyltransferase
LSRLQESDPAAPTLPLIVNRKTVDPTDASSTPVIQLETAMGAAIGAIDGAQAILVPRIRFAPVKTTDDLLVVRSDAYELRPDGAVTPTFDGEAPIVTLDPEYFKLLPDFEPRFPAGAPSLRHCSKLDVDGDVTFGADVTIEGAVRIEGPWRVPDGEVLRG